MKQTIYEIINKFLKRRKWTYGGVIEDHLRAKLGTKGETTSRRLREMENDETLEKQLVLFKSHWVVQYKLR